MLVEKAFEALEKAYCPYSEFKVGAAVSLNDGEIVTGCNIENISYGLSMCAERIALYKAISMGYKKEDIIAIAVVSKTKEPVSPCGACRQVMQELMMPDASVIMANEEKRVTYLVSELLPFAFNKLE